MNHRKAPAAAPFAVLVALFVFTLSSAEAQTAAHPSSSRPDISGKVNGGFPQPAPFDFSDHTGFVSLFNGKSLDGWDGEPGVWSVQDGTIVGVSTSERRAGNTFLVYRKQKAHDFDLKLEIKVEWGGGSGIQYRSSSGIPPGRVPGNGEPPLNPRWVMIGPQADFWLATNAVNRQYSGQLYSQNTHRGIIVWRGQVVQALPGKSPQLVGAIGDRGTLGAFIHEAGWNQYEIIARGGVILHILNGQLMAVLIDDDPHSSNNGSGLFGLQIEGAPCRVSFRNLWLKKLD